MSAIFRGELSWYGAELRNGDCMTQPEFHKMYKAMPEDFRAELIDGAVFVCEPLGYLHGKYDARLTSVLDAYSARTSGVDVGCNATVILGEKDQVQPDLLLRILPNFGGQSKDTRSKRSSIKGAPELVAEIAYSSRSIDLHVKKRRYELAGVFEYIVVSLSPLQLHWFDLRSQRSITADDDGVFRSVVFPGLWIEGEQLLNLEYQPVMDVLNAGLTSSEHASFVARLRAASGQ